jgi:hypothetical protein
MIQDLLIAKSWEKRRCVTPNSSWEDGENRELDEDCDTSGSAMQAALGDADFLRQMVPVPEDDNLDDNQGDDSGDDLESDIETNGDENDNLECSPFTRMADSGPGSNFLRQSGEVGLMSEPSTPTPHSNRRRKHKELAVITTPVTGRLRKRLRKSYNV